MSDKSFGVGIIGAGHIARVHARHLVRVPGARLSAIADLKREKAAAVAEESGAAVYESAEELLARPDVDAVIVAVPTENHRAVTEQALGAGKHVLCEKPMALTVDDCKAMIAAAESAGKRLTVGQTVRFFPEYANAHRLIAGGAVGKPAAVRVRRAVSGQSVNAAWYSDPERGGGVLFDLLVHEFDWLLWCFGPVARVYAQSLTARLAAGAVSTDYALVTLRHASGVIAHVEGAWGDPNGFHTAFEIAGDGGLLSHDSRRASNLVRSIGGKGVPSGILIPDDDPYFRQLNSFVTAIREGHPFAVTAEDGLAAVEVAAAAFHSTQTGQAVTVTGGQA